MIMTIDEHFAMKYALMNVRDELQSLARRDEHLSHYVEDINSCLQVLNRPHVRHRLLPEIPEEACAR